MTLPDRLHSPCSAPLGLAESGMLPWRKRGLPWWRRGGGAGGQNGTLKEEGVRKRRRGVSRSSKISSKLDQSNSSTWS